MLPAAESKVVQGFPKGGIPVQKEERDKPKGWLLSSGA
jgi:hypothetical protein